MLGLLWNLADVYRQLGDQPAADRPSLDRMIELAGDASDETLVNLLDVADREQIVGRARCVPDQAPDALRAKQAAAVLRGAWPARSRAKHDVAEELADEGRRKFNRKRTLEGFVDRQGLGGARPIRLGGARISPRRSTSKPVDSHEAILARIYLANLLHDYERDKEAADALEPLVKAVQGEGRRRPALRRDSRLRQRTIDLPDPDALAARFHFYRACQYQAEKDLKRARGELDLAINFDPTDADVLIAMYRFPEADDKWRESVRERIRELTQQFQQEIDEDPSDAIAVQPMGLAGQQHRRRFPKGDSLFAPLARAQHERRIRRGQLSRHARPLLLRRRRLRERREVRAPGHRKDRLHAGHAAAAGALRKDARGEESGDSEDVQPEQPK